ncbi:permease, partial [Escherichia coli]|nr:permease [Escherichia coli]
PKTSIICSPMTSLKTSIKTITYLSDIGCLEIQGASLKDVLPYLLLGVLIGSFIYGFIPSAWIAAHAGADNPFAIPLSAVVGIPLYIRAEAVIPLASVLMTKGMGLGALMALIIGSAGASLTEVILLKSMFRMPMIAAFLTVILGMAILMGYLTQLLF